MGRRQEKNHPKKTVLGAESDSMGRTHETRFSPKRAQAFETGAPVNTAVCRTFRVCYVHEPRYQTRWTRPTRSFEDGQVALGDPSRKQHRGGDGRQSFPSAKRLARARHVVARTAGFFESRSHFKLLRVPATMNCLSQEIPRKATPLSGFRFPWSLKTRQKEADGTPFSILSLKNAERMSPAAGQTLLVKVNVIRNASHGRARETNIRAPVTKKHSKW